MVTVSKQEFDSIIDGDKVRLKLKDETLDIERRCDTEYHLAYTQLMQRGILPKAALEKFMQKNAIWSKEDEDTLGELQAQLAKLQIELQNAETHEKGLVIAGKMGELRAECLNLVEVKAAVLSNSCESLADQIRRDAYIAYATVYADTNKPVFKGYEDFLNRADEQVVADARNLVLEIATESFTTSLTGLPEVHYVREIQGQLDDTETRPATITKKKAPRKQVKSRQKTKKAVKKTK